MTKVIIAFVCFINFSLLLFDLGQLPRPQFWIAFLPYFIMLGINTFLMVGIFVQNQLCMLVWLLSYTFLLTLGSILLLQQEFPFYLPIASRVFDDAITIYLQPSKIHDASLWDDIVSCGLSHCHGWHVCS